MKKTGNLITVIVFLLLLSSLAIANLIVPDQSYSENENRYLASKPIFTMDHLLSGTYTAGYETYMNDQFVLRDDWIETKNKTQLFLQKKDIGGVYCSKDGYLIEKCLEQDFDDAQLQKNIKTVGQFFEQCTAVLPRENMSVMIVPTASLILEDKLPPFAPTFDQMGRISTMQTAFSGYRFIDIRAAMQQARNHYIYYKTDHHWTTDGAFIAYQTWCDAMGVEQRQKSDFKIENVTDTFRGSLYSKVLLNECAYDTINIYTPKSNPGYTVTYNLGKSTATSLYHPDCLRNKDQYGVFLGGNFPEFTIMYMSIEN